jgi:hypothetical protein
LNLKGLICAGTDSAGYKAKIEANWGIRLWKYSAAPKPPVWRLKPGAKMAWFFFLKFVFMNSSPGRSCKKTWKPKIMSRALI